MSLRKSVLGYNFFTAMLALALTGVTGAALASPPAAGTPSGSEFKVNTTVANSQHRPAAAMDAAGDSVVVWQSSGQDGSGYGIYAQRYDSTGAAAGAEFLVNVTTTGDQANPDVAMDAAGDFVVVWESPDANQTGVFARRYDSSGTAVSSEFQVNATTTGQQMSPAVAMDAAGDFVVVWEGPDASGDGIYAQRYNSAGTSQGGESLVNTTTLGAQGQPSVAMDAAGKFVVAWIGVSATSFDIYAQRFGANGISAGGEFEVNTTTADNQTVPVIHMDAAGDFVVAWEGNLSDGSGLGIYGQRYNSAGAAQGGEFLVNTATTDDQQNPAIGMDATGGFIIAWDSNNQDGALQGVYAQRYDSNGTALGGETLVNTTTADEQSTPSAAMDASGDILVVWQSMAQDTSQYGVYGQRYAGTHSADLSSTLSISPSGVVMPGTTVVLDGEVENAAATVTGVSAIDAALGRATGVTATLTVPTGSTFVGYNGGGHWTCTGPTAGLLSCSYDSAIAPGGSSPDFQVTLETPDGGGLVLYTNTAGSDDSSDPNLDNDLSATGLFVIGPIVSDGLLDVNRNTSKSGTLQGADMAGNTLSYAVAAAPAHGSVTVQAGGKFSYKPAAGYIGTDSFKFKATAGGFDSNIGTISISVTEHLPTANPASFSMTRNTSHTGKLTASDADKGDKLTYTRASKPAHGSVTVSSSGAFTYTPKANFHGHDSFMFKVSDGFANDTATISISVK